MVRTNPCNVTALSHNVGASTNKDRNTQTHGRTSTMDFRIVCVVRSPWMLGCAELPSNGSTTMEWAVRCSCMAVVEGIEIIFSPRRSARKNVNNEGEKIVVHENISFIRIRFIFIGSLFFFDFCQFCF